MKKIIRVIISYLVAIVLVPIALIIKWFRK